MGITVLQSCLSHSLIICETLAQLLNFLILGILTHKTETVLLGSG